MLDAVMKMKEYAPSAALAPFVRSFMMVELDAERPSALLPDPGVLLSVRYSGAAYNEGRRMPDAVVTGLRDTARHIVTSARGGIIVTAFCETGAARFFAEPLNELFGAMPPLDELVPRSEAVRLTHQVGEAGDDSGRVAAIERFLLARLSSVPVDSTVRRAVEAIRVSGGNVRIGALAAQLELGQDSLEKRFRRVVGTSPKHLASIVRFQNAVRAHRAGVSLTQAAFDAGFSDQSHFIRTFRAVTGAAPREFFRAERS